VAQLYNEHLTSEQISAFFDKQLSPEEQAVFDAHMSTCEQCQRNLADLRLTVSLLRAMPQEAVPRSFVLPVGLTAVPQRTAQRTAQQNTRITPAQQKQRGRFATLRRSVRVLSALAAVLALLLIVSGILPTSLPGASESASTHAPTSSSGEATMPHAAVSTPHVQETTVPRNQDGVATGTATHTPTATQTPTPTGTTTENTSTRTPADQGSGIQPVIDLSQPIVRLSLGIIVLALSIIVLILTRRRRVTVH
jgi:anti-sigma factor RsiW